MGKTKNPFKVFLEMYQEDVAKGSKLIPVCPDIISVDKVKQGTKISIGAPEEYLWKIANDQVLPILLLVDKQEYFKRSKELDEVLSAEVIQENSFVKASNKIGFPADSTTYGTYLFKSKNGTHCVQGAEYGNIGYYDHVTIHKP